MRKSVFLYSLLILIAASGVFAYLKFSSTPVEVAPPTEKLLATVNGDPITTAVFEEKYQRFARRANISAESASKHELKMGFLNKLIETLSSDEKIGAKIIAKAITSPLKQIAQNAGQEGSIVVQKVLNMKNNEGFDAKNANYLDMFQNGIVDPTKVVKCSIQFAS